MMPILTASGDKHMSKSGRNTDGNTHRATKRAVFPGQFDPITNGHLDVIKRGAKLFDEVIVGVGINPDKREMFTLEERVEMISELLRDIPGTRVESFAGLTAAKTSRKSSKARIKRG